MLGKYQLRFGILAVLILANYLLWTAVGEADSSTLRIDFLNVGQGDAILIRTPTQQKILIDGGPNDSVLSELGKILPVWDRNLDLVVATHLDADHIAGLVSVLERYRVGEVLTPPIPVADTTSTIQAWQDSLSLIQNINYADSSDDYQWGAVTWDTLWPLPGTVGTSETTNEYSIVAEVQFEGNSLLLTADITADVEQTLINLYPGLTAEVLKVAHHGSKFSSTALWLQMIHPETAIISVGKNSYGHPSTDTLNRLQIAGADVYRTDQGGTIEVIFEDNGYWVKYNGQKKFYQN